jgi:hypothetical protein
MEARQYRVVVPGLFYENFFGYDAAVTNARMLQRAYPNKRIQLEHREVGPWIEVEIPYSKEVVT